MAEMPELPKYQIWQNRSIFTKHILYKPSQILHYTAISWMIISTMSPCITWRNPLRKGSIVMMLGFNWKSYFRSLISVALPCCVQPIGITFLTPLIFHSIISKRKNGMQIQWICVVPFCIFQITADEQCSDEILQVGDQCESAVEDQDKSD